MILGDQDDCITLFNCMCKEKKTDDGEIVTWDGMSIYNASDDSLLPHLLTGEEYLSNLTRISGSAVSMEEAARDAGLSHEELKDLIEKTCSNAYHRPVYHDIWSTVSGKGPFMRAVKKIWRREGSFDSYFRSK